ncbi:S8 family peptidase [Hymenobacter sp. BT559]|uniref:S8 family peptidase n=1 Tax=Hymenobacter sp. BT559 TaxID=2795729 RepID=UPI0018ECEBE9|nr:S8 family peptidase [Hymenobacter sp. BT559]MBJ6145570.1 S8 family peptidase [Hymenobacter sp. BT559]
MKYILTIILLAITRLAVLAGPPTIPGRLVLKLKHATTPAAVAAALRTLGATGLSQKFPRATAPNHELPGSVDLRGIYQVEVPAEATLAKARAVLLGTGAVEYVEPLYIREPLYQPNDLYADSVTGRQFYLKLISAYRAWDFTKGDTAVVIGLTDTGLRPTHTDLKNKIKLNYADPINGIDDDLDGYVDNFRGWDMANGNNDPSSNDDGANHGSTVGGVLAGQADNSIGMAGVAFNCKFLPVQVFPGTKTGSFAGYEAIVYAADHGCKVINMSWGSLGGYSRFEQDVCTYAAVNKDAVLVAASGNTSGDFRFYPASYEHVLAVSGTDWSDGRSGFATYGYRIDLSAPANDIWTSKGYYADTDYGYETGTSLASPQVAGAAALVRSRFPQLRAEQVAAQLRQSADTAIYSLPANASYRGKLGTGRLNVTRAVAALGYREARVVTSTLAPAQSAGYAPGEKVQLTILVRNLLQPVTGLTVAVTSLSPYLTVQQERFAVGNLTALAQRTNADQPFQLTVANDVPLNTTATLRYRLTAAGGYQTDQYLDVRLNPDFVQLDAGDLVASLSSRGSLAYDGGFDQGGLGVSYRTVGPLLSEGGLLLATSPTRVSDRLRAAPGTQRESFYTEVPIRRVLAGPRADQEAYSTFRDSLPSPEAPRSVGVQVRQRGLAWGAPAARRNFIVLEYSIRNMTADTLKPLYAGFFTDWDLPGDSGRNLARYDSVRHLGYTYDPLATRLYAGVQVLGRGPKGVYAIDNTAAEGTPVYLGNGFSPAEKYLALSGGFGRDHRTAGADSVGTDVSQVLSTQVPRLAPSDSATVAFAVLAAPTLAELQAAADAATAAYVPLRPLATAPAADAAWQVYPNPSTGSVQVVLPAGFGAATASVLNALGQEVARQPLGATGGELRLGALAVGVYTLRIASASGSLVRRLVRE